MKKLLILLTAFLCYTSTLAITLPLQKLKLPPGFNIKIYANNTPDARQMALGDKGTVFVGTRSEGKVYAITNNGKKIITIAKDLTLPNGVAFKDGSLYVAALNRILRYDNIENRLLNPPEPVVITEKLPKKTHHGWKYIKFGPDGYLYIPVGAPCNNCLKEDPRFATIMRMQPDGSNLQIFAKGIRNSIGFDWNPLTNILWFTNNGRDWMGDNLPPDQLDRAPTKGLDFGFPYYHGRNIPDPEYGKLKPASDFTYPALELPAHVAALGMMFYTGKLFPTSYKNRIFIAEHGSWNRSSKVGYRITMVTLNNKNEVIDYQPFISGWLQEQNVWGRPVDILQLPDGSLLISDDYAGMIYRISYRS